MPLWYTLIKNKIRNSLIEHFKIEKNDNFNRETVDVKILSGLSTFKKKNNTSPLPLK